MRSASYRLVGWLAYLAVAVLNVGCAKPATLQRFEFTRLQMGVQSRIALYAGDHAEAEAAAAAAYDRIAGLDQIMSDYRPASELSQLGDRAGQGPIPVSEDLFSVLVTAQRVSEASDGAFDVTVGPMVSLWRRARLTGSLPSEAELDAARARVGWGKITLDPAARTVDLGAPGMRLDLGGIAKGFAAQAAVEVLRERRAGSCLVALAGDIATGEAPPGLPGWSVQVELGWAPSAELLLVNQSVSTSGDSEQFIEIGGARYSHIVDPRTGLGSTTGTTATVLAREGALADALATAICVAGYDDGSRILDRLPGAGRIIRQDDRRLDKR